MGPRKIYEAEVDGCSVVIWEGGKGTRIVYFTEQMAENAADWLIQRANQFHLAKEVNKELEDDLMTTITAFDEPVSEFQLVRRFIDRAKRAGFEVETGLEREQKEIW